MPFCRRKIGLCVLRSALAKTSISPALQPQLFQRSALRSFSAWSNSNCSTQTVSSSSVSSSPQHILSLQNPNTPDTRRLKRSPNETRKLIPLANILEYRCPSTLLSERLSQMAILDNTPATNFSYECPVAVPVIDNFAPNLQKSEVMEPGQKPEAKEAKIIMRIRHKKMKKHKLRKLRKRMYFVWRKQKLARKAKRMAIYNKELEAIKATGEIFDAEEFVRAQLAKARRGGYYRNVFES